jgi:hypothetical protein
MLPLSTFTLRIAFVFLVSYSSSEMATRSSKPPVDVSNLLKLLLDPEAEPSTIQDAPRCWVCLNLDWGYKDGTAIISITRLLKDLQEASKSGCVYCTIICNTGKIYGSEMRSKLNEAILHTNHMNPRSTVICWRSPCRSRDGPFALSRGTMDIQLQMSLSPETEPWGRFNKSESIPTSARSVESMNFCKDRLRECLASHLNCQPRQVSRPTRLLFLGDCQSSMKIVESYKECLQYAALSHCWGSSKNLKLERSNEESMKHLIPWNLLPQAYQDAVTVCRELRIDYLWIDSLCIKQDDKQDWNREAAKMVSTTTR